MKAYPHYLLATCALTLLSACSTPPVVAPAPAPEPVRSAPAPVTPPAPVAAPAPVALPAYLDPSSSIYQNRSVYFDFDQYVVKGEFNAVLADHGKYLVANPALKIRVEGNTDDRGGSEYNLALGQKRAESVIKLLKAAGVAEGQLEAVSYGKEKPKASGSDETARAQNRRVDLSYPAR